MNIQELTNALGVMRACGSLMIACHTSIGAGEYERAKAAITAAGDALAQVYSGLRADHLEISERDLLEAEGRAARGALSALGGEPSKRPGLAQSAAELPPPLKVEGIMAYYLRVAPLMGIPRQDAVQRVGSLQIMRPDTGSMQGDIWAFAHPTPADSAAWAKLNAARAQR